MKAEQGVIDRDTPEPHYRLVYEDGLTSYRIWLSRMDMQEWLLQWGRLQAIPKRIIGAIRVIPRDKPCKWKHCYKQGCEAVSCGVD